MIQPWLGQRFEFGNIIPLPLGLSLPRLVSLSPRESAPHAGRVLAYGLFSGPYLGILEPYFTNKSL